jgi:predicted metal-dependent HD superfamily phosphohydrolase
MNYDELLKKVEAHTAEFFREHTDPKLFYHNYAHTKNVLDKSKRIADHYQLDDRNFFIVSAAACFHDTGQFIKNGEGHEEKSAELAQEFLNGIGVSEEDIAAIKKCIMATALPQGPTSLNEQIICDADMFNLGTDNFKEQNKILKREAEAVSGNIIDGLTWRASSIGILENHVYHTDYCKLLLNKKKEENLNWLKNRQEEKMEKAKAAALVQNTSNEVQTLPGGNTGDQKPKKIKKKDKPERGIETMFRITSSNSIRISVMADNKAHIMISVNSIIISVVLALIIKNLDENRNLLIPTIILMAVNVTTIIYSVLATRPRIANGVFTKEQLENKSVNLLYFGSFYNMDFQDYEEGIKAMMGDSEFLYGSLTKDIFWQGKVLGRKYRLLRTSYTIFLFGIIASVIAFTVAIILSK